MVTWTDLDRELDAWTSEGQTPSFWWRDDDLQRPSGALDRLLELARRFSFPLHLAVVPKGIAPDLADRLDAVPEAWVMQHGLAHVNHEPKGFGASEVGRHRPLSDKMADLHAGWKMLVAAQLPQTLPAFAAPWNRMSADTVSAMPDLGFRLVSTSNARQSRFPAAGLQQVNIHLDPIRWKDGATFRGEARCIETIVTHLKQRRMGEVDADEPTGLLTHHLDMDESTWSFTKDLLERLTQPDAGLRVKLDDLILAESE